MKRVVGRRYLFALWLILLGSTFFALMAWGIRGDTLLTRWDGQAAQYLHDQQESHLQAKPAFRWITDAGSLETMIVFAIAVSVTLLSARQYWILAIWLAALILGEQLNIRIKDVWQRPRPPFQAPSHSWSFPSGHAMGATIGYGMLIYVVWSVLPRRAGRVGVVAVLTVSLIGFSRLILGAHYPSDVMGGFSAGIVWLGLWIMFVETVKPFAGEEPASGAIRPSGTTVGSC